MEDNIKKKIKKPKIFDFKKKKKRQITLQKKKKNARVAIY